MWQCRPIITFSRADSSEKSRMFWNVRAIPRRAIWCGRAVVMSVPSCNSEPDVGGVMPVTTLNSVVLPAPFGPITPNTSPAFTANETPSTAVTPPKRRVSPLTSRAAVTRPPRVQAGGRLAPAAGNHPGRSV